MGLDIWHAIPVLCLQHPPILFQFIHSMHICNRNWRIMMRFWFWVWAWWPIMVFGGDSLKWVIVTFTILHRVMSFNSVSANCHLSVISDSKLYNYSLESPMPLYPHGVQSEDGYSLSLSLLFLLLFDSCSVSNLGATCLMKCACQC